MKKILATVAAFFASISIAFAAVNVNTATKDELMTLKGVGEVSWATPIKKDWRTVPIKEKVELLIAANKAGMEGGASFMNSVMFQVNQQKYFASTDGSYIDQDIHRLWMPISATAVDKKTNKFRTREGGLGRSTVHHP